MRLLDSRPGKETAALLPKTLDGLYGMIYGLIAASSDEQRLARSLEIVEQFTDITAAQLPVREAQTLTMELLIQKALSAGMERAILESASYQTYAARRQRDGQSA